MASILLDFSADPIRILFIDGYTLYYFYMELSRIIQCTGFLFHFFSFDSFQQFWTSLTCINEWHYTTMFPSRKTLFWPKKCPLHTNKCNIANIRLFSSMWNCLVFFSNTFHLLFSLIYYHLQVLLLHLSLFVLNAFIRWILCDQSSFFS